MFSYYWVMPIFMSAERGRSTFLRAVELLTASICFWLKRWTEAQSLVPNGTSVIEILMVKPVSSAIKLHSWSCIYPPIE